MSFLMKIKRKAHGQQRVSQLLNHNPNLAALVMDALVWSAQYDGFDVTEELIAHAIDEGTKYPSLTVNGFLEGFINRALQDGLRGF